MHKLLLALVAALAVAPAARAETKIAVVDFQKALNESDQGKALVQQLGSEMKEKQAQLDAKQSELKTMHDELEKQAAVLDEKAKNQKMAEFDKRQEEARTMFMQLQQELAARQEEATRGVGDRMRAIVKEVAEAGGLQLVLDTSTVAYVAPALDITNECIRKYNAKFPYKPGEKPAGKAGAKPAGGKAK